MFSPLKSLSNIERFSLGAIVSIVGLSLYNSSIRKISHYLYLNHQRYIDNKLPKRIYLLRHAESEGNINSSLYNSIPHSKIKLTQKGIKQSINAGKTLKKYINNESVKFYVSPYMRTIQTFEHVLNSFNENKKEIRIDPRLREQEFGNFSNVDEKMYKERIFVGKFYYRFPNGENGADCWERIDSFLKDMRLDVANAKEKYDNVIIVTHGIIMRIMIMRLLNMSIEKYSKIDIPSNCKIWILEKGKKGRYNLITKIKYMH